MSKDDFMTTEERQARTSSEAALLAARNAEPLPTSLQIVQALEREHAKLEQNVSHFSAGDRVRASGFLFELLEDVDAFLIDQ